jgi:glycine cleavage system H protein
MTAAHIPEDRLYTKDHEWAREDSGEVTVGITAFAVEQLGDVTLVSLDVAVGQSVKAGQIFGTIESVKTLSDLYAPVSGTVVALNAALDGAPELVNEDAWDRGWMVRIAPSALEVEREGLLGAADYRAHVEAAAH